MTAPSRDIAIVIPAYLAEATIGETLASLRQQAHGLERVREVVVADDASADGTVEQTKRSWQTPDPPLRLIERPKNLGQWPNLNDALDGLAGVEWFFIIHADDVAGPDWLGEMLRAIDTAGPRVASVTASYDVLFPDGRIERGEEKGWGARLTVEGGPASVTGTLERGCWWKISSCAIRLDAYRSIGPFDPSLPYMSDLDFVLRLFAAQWAIDYLPMRLSTYRQLESSVAGRSFKTHQDVREWLDVLKRYESYLTPERRQARRKALRRQLWRRLGGSLLRGHWSRARAAAELLGKMQAGQADYLL